MKTNIIGIVIALVLTFAGVIGVLAQDAKVSEVRKVDAYSSIEINSIAEVYFTQADHYSFKVEGKEKYVKLITATVDNGCLVINTPKKIRNIKKGPTIYLTAPNLKSVRFRGVGTFFCEEPLKLEDMDFQISGVGSVEVADLTCNDLTVELSGIGSVELNVDCNHLEASASGIGSLTLKGKARSANISRSGIGDVDKEQLVIEED